MTDKTPDTKTSNPENHNAASKAPDNPHETRAAQVIRLLCRKTGATLPALQKATGWQAHSIRAAMSGLRKSGYIITRADPAKPGGNAVYRITAKPGGSE